MPPRDTVKFLLVDDLEENLAALEALLRRDGLELLKARSGPDALELLLVHDFALALLDVQMAGMDGFELAELMRGTERTRRVPIVFITAVATDERRRFRGYEAGAVDYLFKPVEPQLLRNKADLFFELARQKQELARQRDELHAGAAQLAEALDRLRAHGDNSPLAMVEFDPEIRIIGWSQGAQRLFGWSAEDVLGTRIGALRWADGADGERLAALLGQPGRGGAQRSVHATRNHRKDGTALDCEWYSSALRDPAGKVISIHAQILDITDRRRNEETQQLLIGELNHRVKNTLATVQAIATQTLRHSGDPSEFAANFAGRIQSVARAHSLLSSTTWQGAGLAELIRDQLRLGAVDETRLSVSGPDVRLSPQLALHLALILHELGTNARKYGALSTVQGQIMLSWTVDDGLLRLSWVERSGPAVKAPTKRGFGTTLIEQSVRAEGGTARATYRADGVSWEMTLSLLRSMAAEAAQMAAPAPAGPAAEGMRGVEQAPARIAGRRLLIVEDEPLVALELATVLRDAGAEVVGPVGAAEQALQLIESMGLDAALLDGNLHGRPVDDVAAALTRRKVPFVFVTGYGQESLPRAFAKAPVLGKPFTHVQLLEAATRLVPEPGDVLAFGADRARSRLTPGR